MSYVSVAALALAIAKALWILIQDIKKYMATPKAEAAEVKKNTYWDMGQ